MTPHSVLQQYWGYSAFRPMQEDIIRSVLEGRDTLALLPTGGGKSICYQVPALCQEGLCLVVSPLIALMKDQVYNLKKRGIDAAAIFSGMSRREIDILFENACNGQYKLLYISPERLKTELARARIARMNVNLLAVDEAHCISQWGYDFRPPYLEIAEIRALLPKTPVMALTATATSDVVKDIQERLAFRQNNVFQQSFERKNLSYSVLYEEKKHEKLIQILQSVPGTGIVYARSRGETKELAFLLQKHQISADYYHAGLPADERSTKQDNWIAGKTRIICCTNAFGMGIDKPDVRIVVHLNLPDSLEAYFQEAGRGGRDGKKSYAVLLYQEGDGDSLRYFFDLAFPPMTEVRRVYQALGSYTQLAIGAGLGESFDFDLQHFCAAYSLEHAPAHAALRLLEQEGWISISDPATAPSRVHITADKQTVYDYQLRNKKADTVIKMLLRAYPGIQSDYVEVSESMVAPYAKMSANEVMQMLQMAEKEGIMLYEPMKNKPQLTLTRERVSAENLTINQQLFAFRKERAKLRIEQAIRYAEQRICRSQQLLAYFGEDNGTPCGICDVCTGRNKSDLPQAVFDSYAHKIKELLQREPLSEAQILEAFATKRHETVLKTLNFMLVENVLTLGDDGLIRQTSPKS
jgi:ATP-dependent DNA helicase RecQ